MKAVRGVRAVLPAKALLSSMVLSDRGSTRSMVPKGRAMREMTRSDQTPALRVVPRALQGGRGKEDRHEKGLGWRASHDGPVLRPSQDRVGSVGRHAPLLPRVVAGVQHLLLQSRRLAGHTHCVTASPDPASAPTQHRTSPTDRPDLSPPAVSQGGRQPHTHVP